MKSKSEQGGPSIAVCVRLSKEVFEDLLLVMDKNHMTKTEVIERAIVDLATVVQLMELKEQHNEEAK